jgi:hypothetical protein
MIDRLGNIQYQHLEPRESTVHVGHKRARHGAAETRTVQLPHQSLEQTPVRKADQHEIVQTDRDASRRLLPIVGRAEIGGAQKQREDTGGRVCATV